MQDRRTQPVSPPIDEWRHLAADGDFEEALEALEQVAARLNGSDVSLQHSIECYEAGKALHARCQRLLSEAQARIEGVADATPTPPGPAARSTGGEVDEIPF